MIQILIVDDEKPICDLIQMSLTPRGLPVHVRVRRSGRGGHSRAQCL